MFVKSNIKFEFRGYAVCVIEKMYDFVIFKIIDVVCHLFGVYFGSKFDYKVYELFQKWINELERKYLSVCQKIVCHNPSQKCHHFLEAFQNTFTY